MKKLMMSILIVLSAVTFASEVKEGTGLGYADDIKVAVTMDGDKIVAIEVKESSDTPGIANPAIEQLTKKIIETQSTKVDTIAGATYTSEGFLEAVNNATGK
ncbi:MULTISPECIES: FMN-binding protein [Cetobacterium]|jgi:fumarate reductase flavoprotein subunit|uniref:FMN-binding protein n=1 Tax=Candidatus Cetobacterium colombiensis TaxID=3073100 RepID=A0ABU4W971_9FUSO|nr:FMN-binding protein [Candidatus Cetobacterium colombiensis]MDX8336086.1 FMN-binding protein [Candidatus Cetobacterium colombiensis]